MNNQFRHPRRSLCTSLAISAGLGLVAAPGRAQNVASFPERPVRLIVQFAPGGAVDQTARLLAKELGDLWGKAVIVENKPGGSGVIGGDALAKAPPDGHTLLLATDGTISLLPLTMEKMPYDTLGDLIPISMVGVFPQVLVASSALNVKTLPELLAAARSRPGGVDYATNGIGSSQHLAWEQFQPHAGVTLTHVPFKSAPPALQEVIAGRVGVMLTGLATAWPYFKDGRLVPLAIGGQERQPSMPAVPTVAELGFPELDVSVWMGIFAPKGTSAALLGKIGSDLAKVTRGKAYSEGLAARGTEARTSTARELSDRIRVEYERNGRLLKSIGFKPG